MRIFIAALLPEDVICWMGDYLRGIKPHVDGVKWEKPEKLHLTLKFLGETQEQTASKISELLGQISENYSPFRTKVTRLGGFPGMENPRILYLGLEHKEGLSTFQKEVESALEPLGFPKERKRFIPHVTIGRVKKRFITKGPVPLPEKIAFDISKVAVIKSELKPGGSEYTEISVVSLSA